MKLKIRKACFYGVWFVKFFIKMVISLVITMPLRFSNKFKDLWLIMELPNEARDNGYWLYKYIVEHHPEVNVRYVLNDTSPDYAKMPVKEKIIKPYSWSHYMSYALSVRAISTHVYGASPGRYYTRLFTFLMPKKETVFLQHGITQETIPLRGYSEWTTIASKTEIKHFVQSGHNQPEKILHTGFCRFDNLSDISRHQHERMILIMPTFRSWLGGHTVVDMKVFLQSDYFKKWCSLMNNKEFGSLVERGGYKVVFYPHRQMQAFAKVFKNRLNNRNIEIAVQSDYDIQDLLRKASLLVTDYSSVSYDFSYMKKPVIFYPFDSERFYTEHHQHSGEPYPFGSYVEREDALIKTIKAFASKDFKLSKKTSKEVDEFFIYTDRHNSERNFRAIMDIAV